MQYTAVGQQFQTEALAAVDGTGLGFVFIPQSVSAIVELAPPPTLDVAPPSNTLDTQASDANQGDIVQTQTNVTADRRIVLRIVSALQTEGGDIPLPDRALNDLPGLFKKLPDGHYRVYLVEDGRERLVIDVMVRGGRPVDSSEDSSAPPTARRQAKSKPTTRTDESPPGRFVPGPNS